MGHGSIAGVEIVLKGAKPVASHALIPEPLPENPSAGPPRDPLEDQPQDSTPRQPYLQTLQSSYAPLEPGSPQTTTLSSDVTPAPSRQQPTRTTKTINRAGITITPVVPAIPNIPLASRPPNRASVSAASDAKRTEQPSLTNADHLTNAVETPGLGNAEDASTASEPTATSISPPAKTAPKSWADLVKTMAQATVTSATNGPDHAYTQANGFGNSKNASLVDALSSFSVNDGSEDCKISFLEPRGLVNTGNMCYMNSVSICQSVYCSVRSLQSLICRSRCFKY